MYRMNYCCYRLGRRTALVLFSGVSAIFFLSLAFMEVFVGLEGFQTLFIVFVLLGKLGVAGARSSIRVLTVESYPVSIRTMGFGMARIAAALGGICAPQLVYLGTSNQQNKIKCRILKCYMVWQDYFNPAIYRVAIRSSLYVCNTWVDGLHYISFTY